jgi:hypothetical protein
LGRKHGGCKEFPDKPDRFTLRHRGLFPERTSKDYISAMKNRLALSAPRLAGMLLAFAAFAAVSGLAFAMWMRHGTKIFFAMAESGLSWCF